MADDFRLYLHDRGSIIDDMPPTMGGVPLFMGVGSKRSEGVFMPEVPNIGWLLDKNHQHIGVVGVPGGIWQSSTRGVLERQVRLRVKGPDIQGIVGEVLDTLGSGDDEFYFVVQRKTPDGVFEPVLYLPCRLRSFDTPEWNGWVTDSHLCDMTINFAIDRPLWRKPLVQHTVDKFNPGENIIQLDPQKATEPIWPEITITGRFKTCRVRPSNSKEWQQLPSGGGIIITDPSERATLYLSKQPWTGFKPYWGVPLDVSKPSFIIDVDTPGEGFKAVFKYTPLTWRAW